MLTASIAAFAQRLPAGGADLGADLRAGRSRAVAGWCRVGEPVRPEAVAVNAWRRMSRLTRLAAEVVVEVQSARPELPWAELPLVWGSALGEVVASSDFLDRLLDEGPQFASALAFQSSVYNAAPGHLGLALGLRGPTETLSAGMATGLAALARGIEWLPGFPAALVVVGDDLNRTTEAAYAGTPCPGGEAVIAVLLTPGAEITVRDGIHAAEVARATALPYERRFVAQGGLAPERTLGLCCTNGLAALLAGFSAVDQDDALALTATPAR